MAQPQSDREAGRNKSPRNVQGVQIRRKSDNRTDWHPVNRRGRKSTIREDFIQTSSERVTDPRIDHGQASSDNRTNTQNVVVSRAQQEKPKVSKERIGKIRKEFAKQRAKGVPVKGIAKKSRGRRARIATLIAIATCLPWYGAQIVWWMFSLIGLAIESGESATDMFGLGFWAGTLAWATSKLVQGQTIFMVGWLLSSVFGLIQVVQTFVIYKIRRVDPLRGDAFPRFGIVLALYMMPLGFFFWIGLWMWSVVASNSKK